MQNFTGKKPFEQCLIKAKAAFSLLEIAIVLLIIGVIISGGLVILTAATQSAGVNATVDRIGLINKALLDYTVVFGRLPCPANLTLAASDINYGKEAASNSNTCYGGTPSANFQSTGGIVEGAVPVRSLQLPDNYMFDAWGRKIRYAVKPAKTTTSSFPPGTGAACNSAAGITVKDAAGVSRTTTAVYALVSHGSVGHGGYTKNGVPYNAASTNTDELTNCHCTSAAVAGTYTANYVQKLPTQNSAAATDNFDDIVSYREAWQMQNDNTQMSSACNFYIWVADYNNNRVQKFDSNGTFITAAGAGYNGTAGSVGTCGYSAGQICNPIGLSADSNGNIYVSNGNTWDKFDKNGVFVAQVGTLYWGSGNGQESGGGNHVIDASGNFWYADAANYRLQEFTSGFSWIRSRGGPSPHTCETSPSGSVPACANGSGNGQFGYLDSIAIDTSGNLWVPDNNSHRVIKLDSTGSYVSQFPCASGICSTGTTSGLFSSGHMYGIGVDTSGNMYVSDDGAARVQKFTSAGVYVSQFPCASGACSNGTTNGVFSTGSPDQLAIDMNGDVWVGDYSNNRVQKFSNGVFVMQLGCGGTGSCSGSSANGMFSSPEGIVTTSQ